MSQSFAKYQALGNNFILVNALEGVAFIPGLESTLIPTPKTVRRLCDVRYGIGADGLILLEPGLWGADYGMRIFNADGTQAEMCGNGIRCLDQFARAEGLSETSEIRFSTGGGTIITREIEPGLVEVDMGEPVTDPERVPCTLPINKFGVHHAVAAKHSFLGYPISIGNPHFVTFVSSLLNTQLNVWGPALENHPGFPEKANVHFVEVHNTHSVSALVWERGVGATQACGTGACAIAVAGVLSGKTSPVVGVKLPGGELNVEWDLKTNRLAMTGPAMRVFTGTI